MNRTAKLVLFCGALFGGRILAEEGAYEADLGWEKYQLDRIDAIPAAASTEDVLLLAKLSANESADPHITVVKERAWQRLSSIPNFPDVLARRIQEEREKWISGKQTSSVYSTERLRTIQAMEGIRHPGIVRVLGDLLSDMEKPGENEPSGCGSIAANGRLAANALAKVIENVPVRMNKNSDTHTDDQVVSWQLWYEQVKAGARTFRFKGDPQEYNLQGPVSGAATPASAKPSLSPPAGPEKGGALRGVPKLALIVSSVVLGLAVVFLLRGRRRKPL